MTISKKRPHLTQKTSHRLRAADIKQQWAREIAKFSDLQSQIIGGPPHKRKTQYRHQVSFFIINYELILRDLSVINQELSPDLIIMDEAQRIKNWRTKIASAIKLIPSSDASAVWLFSEAVPKGILTNTEAALIMQVLGLSQGSNIPEELLASIMQDAADFVEA